MIVVTTPTGHIGSRVVRLLLQAGERPRVLARDPARLDVAVRERVDARRRDLTDAASVHDVLRDAQTLFLVDPTPHTAADPVGDSDRLGALVAGAVRDAGVQRVVFVSSIGAEQRHRVGHIDGLARIEEHLDDAGADICHLRCGYFFTNLLLDPDGLAEGVLTTAADPGVQVPWVDPRDIGDVAAARLLSTVWHGRVVQAVHGPEDLSWTCVADILAVVLGRPVRVAADDRRRRPRRTAGRRAAAGHGRGGRRNDGRHPGPLPGATPRRAHHHADHPRGLGVRPPRVTAPDDARQGITR